MRSYFIFAVIILMMVTHQDKVFAGNSFKPNPLQQNSVSSHIKHFQQCGFDSGDIDIKTDADDKSAISLIAYIIKGHSIDLECLLSSKSRTNPIANENTPLLFDSLYDYGMGESEFPLKEGLIEFDDRVLIFTAPSSDLGIEEIKNVSNEYIVIKVGTFTHSRNFLVSTGLMEITYLSDV